MADDYVCTLDEKSEKKAKKELNEKPSDRTNAISSFRNLIQTRAPHVKCSLGKLQVLFFYHPCQHSEHGSRQVGTMDWTLYSSYTYSCILSSVIGNGHAKYMTNPFFTFI